MQIGVVGLGRMGGNIARRLMRRGLRCVVFDREPVVVQALVGEGPRARARWPSWSRSWRAGRGRCG